MMGGRKDAYAQKLASAIVTVARLKAGSRQKLAQASGVDRGQLQRVESAPDGAGLSWTAITMLARAVGMKPSALIAAAEDLAVLRAAMEPAVEVSP